MEKRYHRLNAEDRATIMVMTDKSASVRAIAGKLGRYCSTNSVLFDVVWHYLQEGWWPKRIAGTLKRVFADDSSKTVSQETIYNAIYVMPRGELRTALIACLRQSKSSRRERSGSVDRRGQIPTMARLSERPSEADDRLTPAHWEGDLIKGAGNKFAVWVLWLSAALAW